MTATEFGLGLLYIAVAAIWYAAGWWQGKTVERDRREERAAPQDQLAQRDQQGQRPEVMTSPSIGMRSTGQLAVSPSRLHETQPVNYA
jgi:hypothetical protein